MSISAWNGAEVAVFLDGAYEDDRYYEEIARDAARVVAADGGARFLLTAGLAPDLLVGDFDSLPPEDVKALAEAGVEVLRYPVRKDATDGELAVDEALRRGAGEIVLAGALGALDHTWGHLVLLRRAAERRVRARIASPGLTVRVLVGPERVVLGAPPTTRVSVVPLAGDALVTLEGFEYDLTRQTLPSDASLGLGNLVSGEAAVEVHDGVVAVLVFDGAERFRRSGEGKAQRAESAGAGEPDRL